MSNHSSMKMIPMPGSLSKMVIKCSVKVIFVFRLKVIMLNSEKKT
jgi:hypothetical protein